MPRISKERRRSEKRGRGVHAIIPYIPSEVQLKQTYQMYGLWKHLPPVMRELSDDDLEKKFGIESEAIRKLLKIRTQTEFGAEFNVSKDTMTDWNVRLENTSPMAWIRMWARPVLKNIALAGLQNAMKGGGTAFMDRQFFFKAVGEWEESSTVKVEGLAEGLMAAMKAKPKLSGNGN